MRCIRSFWLLCHVAFAVVAIPATAQTVVGAPKLGRHFSAAGVQGTFVLYDPGSDTSTVYNPERAKQRYYPASTFKIANAVIGLDAGSVKDLDEVLPYGGGREFLKVWEQDMNLRDAMKVSNVPVFHTLAKRTGLTRMQEKLDAFDYGNRDIGTSIDLRFWLNGPLTISAMEQTQFLHKLTTGQLPVSSRAVKLTTEILLLEKTPEYALYAKTGWVIGGKGEAGLGWWVGWVQRGDVCYPFALNIDIKKDEDAPKRLVIGRACLRELGRM